LYKLVLFNVDKQIVEVEIFQDNIYIKNDKIAFAHIPKKIKKSIKPL